MSDSLPSAEAQHPACGACGNETRYDGDRFICEDCQLGFSTDDFHAFYLDPEDEPCGKPCENWWHGDNRITPGHGYDCGTCRLPADHTSLCWRNCRPREVPTSFDKLDDAIRERTGGKLLGELAPEELKAAFARGPIMFRDGEVVEP